MSEPTIICPSCKTEIKLTESLAAPLIASTRLEYEKRLAQKDADVAKRETSLREREETISKAQQTIDDQVAEKLKLERVKIATEEAKKAKGKQFMIWGIVALTVMMGVWGLVGILGATFGTNTTVLPQTKLAPP